jgi:hypothetical protein
MKFEISERYTKETNYDFEDDDDAGESPSFIHSQLL